MDFMIFIILKFLSLIDVKVYFLITQKINEPQFCKFWKNKFFSIYLKYLYFISLNTYNHSLINLRFNNEMKYFIKYSLIIVMAV